MVPNVLFLISLSEILCFSFLAHCKQFAVFNELLRTSSARNFGFRHCPALSSALLLYQAGVFAWIYFVGFFFVKHSRNSILCCFCSIVLSFSYISKLYIFAIPLCSVNLLCILFLMLDYLYNCFWSLSSTSWVYIPKLCEVIRSLFQFAVWFSFYTEKLLNISVSFFHWRWVNFLFGCK